MEEYKLAMKQGNIDKAEKFYKAARQLVSDNKVTEDELMAAAYL